MARFVPLAPPMSPRMLQCRPRVLLAAELPELRDVLRRVLEDAAYDVTVTGNGIEAIGLVLGRVPDVLVLELELQPLDGLLALEVLRAAGRHVPAVLLSPVVDAGVTRAAARLGISAVIRKPFRNAE